MRVYCRLSGTEFSFPGFGNLQVLDRHPLFFASTKTLIAQAPNWKAGKLSADQSKVLFLALLYNTGLVDFKIVPDPSPSIVVQNMESAFHIAGWKDALPSQTLYERLPRFVINHTTKFLDNIPHWFEEWFKAREDWRDGYKTERMKEKLARREAILYGYIHSPSKNKTSYLRHLSEWTMTALGKDVNEETQELWKKLFHLDGIEVYKTEYLDDLSDLLDWMNKRLQPYFGDGNLIATKAIRHIRELHFHCKAGFNYGLGMPSDEDEKADAASQEYQLTPDGHRMLPYRFVEDPVERHNKEVIIQNAPLSLPLEKDYPSKLAYLRAKAAWEVAQRSAEAVKKLESKQLSLSLQETLEAIDNREDTAFTPDLLQPSDLIAEGLSVLQTHKPDSGDNND